MPSEIGSNFWDYSIENRNSLSHFFWGGSDYYKQYFKSGRNAIKALCRSVEVKNERAIVPIYTCETVIQPFLDEGWDVFFYRIERNLTIDEDDIASVYAKIKPGVVLAHSYFGFDTLSEECLRNCQKEGAIIVEDMTQSLFSGHHLNFADYYITSFRKFLAIPDGGALISRNPIRELSLQAADADTVKTALNAFQLKRRYMQGDSTVSKEMFRNEYMELNELIEKNGCLIKMNSISLDVLNACEVGKIGESRRENYNFLYNTLSEINGVSLIFGKANSRCVPLYCPVYVDSRKNLQDYLATKSIYCPIIWPKPPQITVCDDDVRYIYEHILCIPVDQRYGLNDMETVVRAFKEFDF